MRLRYKVWLETSGKAFGDGPYDLLERVDRLGSLRQAAGEMKMSYSQAWQLVNTLEKRLGFKLLKREVGGSSGGGSYLTAEARNLVRKYANFREEVKTNLENIFCKHFG